ncbi:MAG: hypothetical protein OEY14_07080 [Myxococcales bacterium]|nr:hypothetical protein [Myxococcales bacterium]
MNSRISTLCLALTLAACGGGAPSARCPLPAASDEAAAPFDTGAVGAKVEASQGDFQRCFDRASRAHGLPQAPSTRMDIVLHVSASGEVTEVELGGEDFGGLGNCLEQVVRGWCLAPSAEGGRGSFPVNFSSGD